MQIGDIVAVIDPDSARRGTWGLLSDTTRTGMLIVNFVDGSVETMDPFQVEDYAGLAAAAVTVRGLSPSPKVPPARPAIGWRHSRPTADCECGHPEYRHREYRGYVACTCRDTPRRQCRCRAFDPPSEALRPVLRQLFDQTIEYDREDDVPIVAREWS